MSFITKLDFSNNRQVKQNVKTNTSLSGGTVFGVPFDYLPTGPDLTSSAITSTLNSLVSEFSGNSTTTIFSWNTPSMNLANDVFSALTPSNSGATQNSGFIFSGNNSGTTIDGNFIYLDYTGVTFDITPINMVDLGGGNYSGTVDTMIYQTLSAGTLDYSGRTIWVDVSGITRTNELIVQKDAMVGYVLTCVDNEGRVGFQPASAATTSATTYWSAGTGLNSIAIKNFNSTASGNYSISEGFRSSSDGNYSKSSGYQTWANNEYAYVEGYNSTTRGLAAHAEGWRTTAIGTHSHSEGSLTVTIGEGSHAEGSGTTALGFCSHVEGSLSVTSGEFSHAEGYNTTASGETSHSEGNGTTASGDGSHSEGMITIASGDGSHSEGILTTASGNMSHAEGYKTTAIGDYTHVEGGYNKAIGDYSHAEGNTNTSIGFFSHAEGSDTISSGTSSHAEGSTTTAIGEASHSEGLFTTSVGEASHSEGIYTTAIGVASHSGGLNSKANGEYSFVHGFYSTANADHVMVLGSNITGNTPYYTYVNSLNIKTIDSSPSVNDIRIDANGNLTTNTSDVRMKENITPLTNSLEIIKQLSGVTFQWKDRNAGGDDVKLGFIAQDVEEVIPELVFTNKKDGYKGIHIDGVIPLLVEAVKELSNFELVDNKIYLETQTIIAEDNNIDLNHGGTKLSAINGGLRVINALGEDSHAEFLINEDGDWKTNNRLIPNKLIIPTYSSRTQNDKVGSILVDDDYLYVKTNNGWKCVELVEIQ